MDKKHTLWCLINALSRLLILEHFWPRWSIWCERLISCHDIIILPRFCCQNYLYCLISDLVSPPSSFTFHKSPLFMPFNIVDFAHDWIWSILWKQDMDGAKKHPSTFIKLHLLKIHNRIFIVLISISKCGVH